MNSAGGGRLLERPAARPRSGARFRRIHLSLTLLGLLTVLTGCEEPRPVDVPLGEDTGQGSLSALYWSPPRELSAGVVLLHGLGGSKEDWQRLASRLRQESYAVLALDFREQGRTSQEMLDEDVRSAVAFLRQQKKVDAARLALVGASLGGNAALVFAGQEPLVRAVALLSPGLNFRGVATEPALRGYGARPLFLAAAEEDFVSAQAVGRLAGTASGAVTSKIYPGTAHGIDLLTPAVGLEADLIAFLRSTL